MAGMARMAHVWELFWAPFYREEGWKESNVAYFPATLVFITVVYLFETYLDFRQHQKLKEQEFPQRLASAIKGLGDFTKPKAKRKAPIDGEEAKAKDDEDKKEEELAKPISLYEATVEKFDTSRAYGLDKSSFGFLSGAYSQLESTVLLMAGYLPFMWVISGHALQYVGLDGTNEISRALVLITLTTIRDTLVGLPFGLYETFVIEERHGFNKQTLRLFFMDKLKSFLLFVAIGFPLCAALIYVIRWGGEHFYLYVWLLLLVFSIFMITIIPIWIMPLFNKFEPLEEGELRSAIEALASRVSFPLTKLFVCDGSKRSGHSNAYFYGFFKSKRIVLYDTLLEQATNDEIVAILGHELGHWKLWHTMQGFVIQQVYTFVLFYVFGRCMNDDDLFSAFGFESTSKPVIIGLFLFSQTIWAPIEHVLSFLTTLHTRHNEFQADAFATKLGYGNELQSGLTKIHLENLSNMNPDWLYSTYHYSHPPLVERLTAVAKVQASDKKKTQ